jgi:NodT family efflux transporter outer membrane factor (OMF) lipoprotein
MVGPKYQRPPLPAAPAFKEQPPAGWKEAQPSDSQLKGKWWEIYNDPALNALEEQVSVSNQNVLAAMAQYEEARAQVRIARSALYPTVTTSPGYTNSGTSGTLSKAQPSVSLSEYSLPFDVSYQADLWGSVRHSIRAAAETAQASAADVENIRLTNQAQLAQDYFQMHGLDSQEDLLERTVKAYQEYLELTQNRFQFGIASGADVALAETQLYTAQAQLIDLEVQRTQYEHAIAILVGKPPSEVTIPRALLSAPPPDTPTGVPSALLERRPDIAANERMVASANEQIGIAVAALYPSLTISAAGGFESDSITKWLTWPSRFWSLGPQFTQTLFAGGRLHAQIKVEESAYDATVANYRQTVLTAFQQVEDELAALRILETEATAQDKAVKAAQNALDISTDQYKQGIATYLQVILAQSADLQNEQTAVAVLTRRLTSSVLLVEALGGGWNASQLPTYEQIRTK